MNLQPLKIAEGTAGTITVVCRRTGRRAMWNDAVLAGWVADLDGTPFDAYYSPRTAAEMLDEMPGTAPTTVQVDRARFWPTILEAKS